MGSPPSSADRVFTPASDKDSADHLKHTENEFELEEIGRGGRQVIYEASEDAVVGAQKSDEDEEEEDGDDIDNALLAQGRRPSRASSAHSFELYTPDEEKAVIRKLDVKLALYVAFLYMMSFLDRSNLGNANVARLSADLNLTDDQFQWLITAFYITYIAFEWMTLCYKIFRSHVFISCCVAAWGIIASLQSLVGSFGFLIVLRIFLGIGEAAFTGIPFYLSFFYKREELAFRTGIFIAAAPLATSFASGLAWIIVKFGDLLPIANWRLIFLVEGFPACIVAVWTYYWLPDSPGEARWLNFRERKIAKLRKRKETNIDARVRGSGAPATRQQQAFRWDQVKQTLLDPKAYITASMFFCVNVGFGSVPVFLPVILKDAGYSRVAAEGLSAIPMLVAFVVVLLTAWLSDRYRNRSVPLIAHGLLATSGYLFLAIAGPHVGHTLRYLAFFPICAGLFSCVTLIITWTVNNQPSDEAKGTGIALMQYIGQCGPILGTRVFREVDAPYFVQGMLVGGAAMFMVSALSLILRVYLNRENVGRRRRWSAKPGQDMAGEPIAKEFVFIT
ncbi:putative transporter [Pseudocercospora fuligena]|uniref:Putative transporter n=1 Tax=Pseudocercospora fuligena TaxID=685502 RepID=A0A8H6RJ20_9PEZI|nr:putative transporter [Pseudocercospora fuligena]